MSANGDNTVLTLASELLARASVTPDDAGCQAILASRLAPLGFQLETIRCRRRHQSLGQARPGPARAGIRRAYRCRASRA